MAGSRRDCRPARWSGLAKRSGLRCSRKGFPCSTSRAGRRCIRRSTKEDTVADVALVDVSKRFGPVEAVSGLSLSIADGEFVVLLGPTGAGKTTTLRMIAGLERPDRGTVLIAGRDVTAQVP